MLKMDEKTLLKEAREINLDKLQQAIKQVQYLSLNLRSTPFLFKVHLVVILVCAFLILTCADLWKQDFVKFETE